MASPVIPKEKLTTCQPWSLRSFDAPAAPAHSTATAAKAKHAEARARAESLEAGRREGYEAGRREAFNEHAASVAHLDELVAGVAGDLARLDSELARDVVDLALTVARKIIGESVRVREDIVLNAVEDALRHVGRVHGELQLVVHPQDAALVRTYLTESAGARPWSLREDPTLARGGCRLEAAGSEIDATIAQRWQRVTAALGTARDWIE